MKLLNLGCGTVYHDDWVNIDVATSGTGVLGHDILKGIPFPDSSFDAVYHSHLLEHLPQDHVPPFLRECFRVMKPGGLLRVVVPDLEGIVASYQAALYEALVGTNDGEQHYDWIMLEIYDQAVRSSTGGMMIHCLNSTDVELRDFIRQRIGLQAEEYWTAREGAAGGTKFTGLFKCGISFYLKKIRSSLAKAAVTIIMGTEGREALELGMFRNSGEIHHWMYDRFSLRRALQGTGFTDIRSCAGDESRIPGFSGYELDTVKGSIRKPDSLFMEGVKP